MYDRAGAQLVLLAALGSVNFFATLAGLYAYRLAPELTIIGAFGLVVMWLIWLRGLGNFLGLAYRYSRSANDPH